MMKIKIHSLVLSLGWVLVFTSSPNTATGWKPIAPPSEYYATVPSTCVSDCDTQIIGLINGGAGGAQAAAAAQLQTVSSNPLLAFNREKDLHQESTKKLDLEGFEPAKIPFFPEGFEQEKFSALPNYQEALKKAPVSFVSFNTFEAPQKITKTIHPQELNLKYAIGETQNFGNDAKFIVQPPHFPESELAQFQPESPIPVNNHCSAYKASFQPDLYYQYLQYKVRMPDLKEFTICLWARFYQRSPDHSLFSYASKPNKEDIYMWMDNLQEPGVFSMKVKGQAIFRLNYPIKLYKWYHTCQSWNGHTGEWQVWVDGHRIARGFHNSLVGQKIPGKGVAISGQNHKHFEKGVKEIPPVFRKAIGLNGEITMLQLYKVALTPGKAYNDHTYHHSHYTTPPPEPPQLPEEEPPSTTEHPFLENGQLKKVNILELTKALKAKEEIDALKEQQKQHQQLQFYHSNLYNPFLTHAVPLPIHENAVNYFGYPNHALFKRNGENSGKGKGTTVPGEKVEDQGVEEQKFIPKTITVLSKESRPVKVEKVKFPTSQIDRRDGLDSENVTVPILRKDQRAGKKIGSASTESFENFPESLEGDDWFSESSENEKETPETIRTGRAKRHNSRKNVLVVPSRNKRIATGETVRLVIKTKRGNSKSASRKTKGDSDKESSQRQYVFGEPFAGLGGLGQAPEFGVVQLPVYQFPQTEHDFSIIQSDQSGFDEPHLQNQQGKKIEIEIAEVEVRRIMEVCSVCQPDPYRKVAVISWRSTPKKVFSGAILVKGKPECGNF